MSTLQNDINESLVAVETTARVMDAIEGALGLDREPIYAQMPSENKRFAEIGYDDGTYYVVLWESFTAEGSAGEHEFASFANPDLQKFVEAWVKYGRVIF